MGPAGARPGSPPSPPLLLLLLLLLLRAERPRGAELTFELPDSAKQCFHEDVERGAKFSLDYQVRPRPDGRHCGRAGGSALGPPCPACTQARQWGREVGSWSYSPLLQGLQAEAG